jgi:hypothetical protein
MYGVYLRVCGKFLESYRFTVSLVEHLVYTLEPMLLTLRRFNDPVPDELSDYLHCETLND